MLLKFQLQWAEVLLLTFVFCKSALERRFQAERLPPTTNAAHFHSLRAHMQIVTWESLGPIHLDPTVWGWLRKNDSFSPIVMTSAVAPDVVEIRSM